MDRQSDPLTILSRYGLQGQEIEPRPGQVARVSPWGCQYMPFQIKYISHANHRLSESRQSGGYKYALQTATTVYRIPNSPLLSRSLSKQQIFTQSGLDPATSYRPFHQRYCTRCMLAPGVTFPFVFYDSDSLDKDGIGVSPILGLNAMRWLPRQGGSSGFKFRSWTGLLSRLRNKTSNDYTNVTP